MGRPSKFSQAIADALCEGLIEGKSLRSICSDAKMPSAAAVCRWLGANAGFREQYARAREAQADTLFDEALHIADNQQIGEKRTIKADGSVEVVQADMIEHRKLRIDARKWMAGKLQPKKYGEKLDVEHGGSLTVVIRKPGE